MSKSISLLAILCLLCIFISSTSATYLTLQVDARKSRCHYEELDAGQSFSMYFEVIRGGLLDIKYQLTDPNRNIVLERMAFFNKPTEDQNVKEGTVQYTARTSGVYKFCFDNTASRWTAKVVSFEIRSNRANKFSAVQLKDLGPMVDTVISLSNELDTIETGQRTSRVRARQHYSSVKSLNHRVQWFVLFSSIILFGLTLLSINNIQKWFETDNRRSGFV